MNSLHWLKRIACGQIILFCGRLALADPLDHWYQRYPPLPMVDFNGITFGNGLFIVVGDSGTILTSPNSTDWTLQSSGVTNHLLGVVFGGGKFVVVGERGRVLLSPDGVNWTAYQMDTTLELRSVTYGGGVFVAVSGSANTNRFWTSPDALTWTNRPYYTPAAFQTFSVNCVAYADGLFLGGGGRTFYSSNALEWYDAYLTNGANFPLESVSYHDGLFVAHARYSSALTRDAKTWTTIASQFAADKYAAAYGGQHHVWVGEAGSFQSSRDEIGRAACRERGG